MSIALPLSAAAIEKPRGWRRLLSFFHRPATETLDRWILAFAVVAPFTNIPQLLKVYVERDADLSLVSWSLYALMNIPLFCHGIIRKDKVVLFNTCMNACMQVLIVIGIILYG